MKKPIRRLLVLLLGMTILVAQAPTGMAQSNEFPLKEGYVVALLGDSITAQHLHSNYIEAYCVTRFPKWNLQFRNAGVGGSTVPSAVTRFKYDVSCWNPAVVTIELGMNDSQSPESVEPYMKKMDTLVRHIRSIGAHPVFFTASPVNNGSTSDNLDKKNAILDKMATEVVKLAAAQTIPCADQFHTLLDLWGKNLKSPNCIPLTGDGVHPGPTGQLTMAYACLVGINAPALVSKAIVDAKTSQVTADKCVINDLKIEGDTVSFERVDECLPMPIPNDGRAGLKLVPLTEKLNQYTLTITGLKGDKYDVSIDGAKVATVSAQDFANGWNMSELTAGPIAAQCQKILDLIVAKETVVSAYREVAKFQVPAWLNELADGVTAKKQAEMDRLMKDILAAGAKLNEAARPKPHRFQIAPAK